MGGVDLIFRVIRTALGLFMLGVFTLVGLHLYIATSPEAQQLIEARARSNGYEIDGSTSLLAKASLLIAAWSNQEGGAEFTAVEDSEESEVDSRREPAADTEGYDSEGYDSGSDYYPEGS